MPWGQPAPLLLRPVHWPQSIRGPGGPRGVGDVLGMTSVAVRPGPPRRKGQGVRNLLFGNRTGLVRSPRLAMTGRACRTAPNWRSGGSVGGWKAKKISRKPTDGVDRSRDLTILRDSPVGASLRRGASGSVRLVSGSSSSLKSRVQQVGRRFTTRAAARHRERSSGLGCFRLERLRVADFGPWRRGPVGATKRPRAHGGCLGVERR